MTDLDRLRDVILRLDRRDPEACARCRSVYGEGYSGNADLMLAHAVLDTLRAMGVGTSKLPILTRAEVARAFPAWRGAPTDAAR